MFPRVQTDSTQVLNFIFEIFEDTSECPCCKLNWFSDHWSCIRRILFHTRLSGQLPPIFNFNFVSIFSLVQYKTITKQFADLKYIFVDFSTPYPPPSPPSYQICTCPAQPVLAGPSHSARPPSLSYQQRSAQKVF